MPLVELAERLRSEPDAVVLVIAEGEGADRVAHEAQSRSLGNLRVLPFQPYEAYGDILASADVLLGLVDAKAGVLFVPSKVTSYLCAGRPVVLSAPWQNLAAQSVRDSGGGRVVPPDDNAAMGDAVLAYLDDEPLRRQTGQQARAYAERTYDISSIADRFERLCERLTTGPRRRHEPQLRVAAR
jgi:glycosyltransferase involved in cell wall biosynthesis